MSETLSQSELIESVRVNKYQYFYRNNQCLAMGAFDPYCICWHDEGTGPLPECKYSENNIKLEWRTYP